MLCLDVLVCLSSIGKQKVMFMLITLESVLRTSQYWAM